MSVLRKVAPAVALAVGSGMVVAQAVAADAVRTSSDSASASWSVGDERNTRVSVFASEGMRRGVIGGPNATGDAFVTVSQSFCDTTADELVSRAYLSFQPIDSAAFRVAPSLGDASLAASVTLSGFEFRIPDCANPNFWDGRFSPLPPAAVTVRAHWQGTGEISAVSSGSRVSSGTFKFIFNSRSSTRPAEATGTLTSADEDLNLGQLPTSESGLLTSGTSLTITIG